MTNTKTVSIKVPWSPPLFEEADLESAIQVIRSCWMTQGKQTAAFEEETAALCGSKYAVAVCNGTAALMAALLACEIGPGDEVLVPTMTFIATVNSVIAVGAKPILVDCDPRTLNVTPELLQSKLTPKTKAILFVDVYGMPCDIDGIAAFAKKHNLRLIEDGAQAIGAGYKGKPVGSFGHLTIISFHMAKLVPTVEGGCILTDDENLAVRMKQIRNHGMAGQYQFVAFGLNLRITDIQSAMGRSQLKKLAKMLELRQALVDQYQDGLKGLVEFQHVPDYVTTHPHMIFSVFLKDRAQRDRVNAYVKEHGVDTRICWTPTHLQPYHKTLLADQGAFPNAEKLGERGLSLPLGNALTPEEVAYAVRITKEALAS